jgi:hypothetical protein
MQQRKSVLTSSLILHPLFGLFVTRVLAATAAELAELQALRRGLLVLRRDVVAALAFRALEHNIIARHNSPSPKPESLFSPG